MSKKNLIVGQSGGPTAVINSSLYGVVSEGLRHPEQIQHIYGMVNGIEGFLAGTVLDFATALPGSNLEKLKTTPSHADENLLVLPPDDRRHGAFGAGGKFVGTDTGANRCCGKAIHNARHGRAKAEPHADAHGVECRRWGIL